MVLVSVFCFFEERNLQPRKPAGLQGCKSFNDFAHLPWEDTPNFPKPPQRKEFLDKLLVKHPGYLPGVCGWDLRELFLCTCLCCFADIILSEAFFIQTNSSLRHPIFPDTAVQQQINLKRKACSINKCTVVYILDINQVICMKKNPIMHMNADQVLQKPDPSTSQTDLATCIPLINFFPLSPPCFATVFSGPFGYPSGKWVDKLDHQRPWLADKGLFLRPHLWLSCLERSPKSSKKKHTHPKKASPKKCFG